MTPDQRRTLTEAVTKAELLAIDIRETMGRLWFQLDAGSNDVDVMLKIEAEARTERAQLDVQLGIVRDLLLVAGGTGE